MGILVVPVRGVQPRRSASSCRPDAAVQRLPNLEHKVMRERQQIQRVSRKIDVNDHTLTVDEHTELENEAGAVVWDAALVLLNYFCTGKTGFGISLAASQHSHLPMLLSSVLSDCSHVLCFATLFCRSESCSGQAVH